MTQKKILLATRPLVPPWDEASKNFAYFLGRSLKNHFLTLLTTKEPLIGMKENIRQVPIFDTGRFNFNARYSLFSYLRAASKGTYDIIHYLFTPTKLNTFLIKNFAFPKNSRTIQTIATLREDLYSDAELRSLLFADQLITYTERTKQKLQQLGFRNVTRIYPGIDLDIYQPREKSTALQKLYRLAPTDFFVVYPGEYTRLGATDMLLETFVQHCTKFPNASLKLLFACRIKNEADRAKRDSLILTIKKAHLENKILFEKKSAPYSMADLYNTADVVIFPVANLHGKFDVPLIIIEAYACGKPVILSDVPQFSEFANTDICVTIPKDSGNRLIESLAYLEQNEEERIRLGTNARRFVENHFDLKNTAQQYEDIYDSL